MRITAFLAFATVALAGCSSGSTGVNLPGANILNALRGDNAALEAPPMESEGFTAQAIADHPENFMIADVPNIGVNQPARLIRQNGNEETWQAQGGATFAFRDGVMSATRGLIDDLLVISTAGVTNALAAGGGTVTRTLEQLDDLDRLSTRSLECTITRDGPEEVNLGLREVMLTKFTERCASRLLVFENAYWLDNSGEIMASRQFVSADVGYARLNRL